MKSIIQCGAIFLLLLSARGAHPAPIIIDENIDNIPIGLNIEYLADDGGTLTYGDVTAPRFEGQWHQSTDANPGFGFTRSVYWVRFTVRNNGGAGVPFFLVHEYPLVDDIRLFIPKGDGTARVVETGDHVNFSKRPYDHRYFVFPLELEAGTARTYYLRQETTSAMNIPLVISSPESFRKWSGTEDRLLLFYFGIMAIMIVNYLCVYLLIRHLSYLNFALFILSLLLFVMTQTGAAFQFLMPDNPGLADICPPLFLCLTNIFGNRFVLLFLRLKKSSPQLKTILDMEALILFIAALTTATIPFLGTYKYVMSATASLTVLTIVTVFVTGLYLVLRRQGNAFLFTLISFGFLVGSILYLLKSFGLMPGNFITTWAMVIGSVSTLLVLSIAMVDRINTMRKGLKVLSENLEKEVKDRSIEFLLNEIGSKIMREDAIGPSEGEATAKYPHSIQSLLEHQRELSIAKFSQDISIISNIDELMEKTIAKVKEISESDRVYLFIADDNNALEARSIADVPDHDRIASIQNAAREVFETGRHLISSSGEGMPDQAGTGADRKETNPVICLPIKSGVKTVGSCYIEREAAKGDFTEKDASLLMEFSDTIVIVIDNALKYQRRLAREQYRKKHTLTRQTEEKIRQAIQFINENYTRDISREGLAASLDISANHLGKYFKVYTGKKINEYINAMRIRNASNMLRESKQENIITIAYSVGFESLSTFNRAFLKETGVTPTEFKDRSGDAVNSLKK